MVWFDVDIIILNNIILMFLVYYMIDDIDCYSDLNPSNSKHILDALHNLLKDLNVKDLFSLGSGGRPDPDFSPYMYLLIDTGTKDESVYERFHHDQEAAKKELLYSSEAKIISEKIDYHNKSLVYLEKGEMIEENNKMISTNHFIDYFFHHPYGLASMSFMHNDLFDFLIFFKSDIINDIITYNNYSLCKFYYESENKDLLHNKFKDLWENWHLSQILSVDQYKELLKNYPDCHIINFLRKDLVYAELNDNILIIGAGILCKVYMYTKLSNDYSPDFNESKVKFFTKAWEYYEEALQKYYPFFHHYNWFNKLYLLENSTKYDIYSKIYENQCLEKGVASIPPLYEYILDWPYRPDWCNNIRPDKYPDYIQCSYVLGSTKVHFEWSNMKDFFTKGLVIKNFIPSHPSDSNKLLFNEKLMSLKPISAKELIDELYKKPVNIRDFYLYRDKYLWK